MALYYTDKTGSCTLLPFSQHLGLCGRQGFKSLVFTFLLGPNNVI